MKSLLALAALALMSVSALAQTAPTVTMDPANATVNAGSTATFISTASGNTTPTVQWQVSADLGVTFNNLTGQTNTTLAFTAGPSQNGFRYRAVFTNPTSTATSATATLTVLNPPIISTNGNPTSISRVAGASASFTAAATNFTSVNWQVSSDAGVTFTNIPGATSTTLTFNTITSQNGYRFRAAFTNADGTTNTSAATLTITNAPTPTPTPTPVTPTPGVSTNGVIIYELSFKHTDGFNVDFWDEGYIIVPATGGDGSALFTATDNGRRTFRSFENSVSFFNARDKHNSYSVMAMAGTSPSIVCIQAFGKADDKIKANGPTYSITVRAAETLKGLAQASRDESTLALTDQPRDGTLGFLEFAEVKATLDQKLTDLANENASSVASMFTYLRTLLTRRGFVEEADTTDDGDGTDGGTDGGTTDGGTTDGGGTTTTTTTN